MTEYSDEQIQELIQKAKQEAAALEQWTIAEDTVRRFLKDSAQKLIQQGIWHPFLAQVCDTMYSVNITGRNFNQQQPEKPDEVPQQD
jgi:hypothetical protein